MRSVAISTKALLCKGHCKESFPWNFVLEKLKAGNRAQQIVNNLQEVHMWQHK